MDGLEEIIGIVLLGLLSGLGSFFKAKGKKGADAKKAPAGTSPAGSSRGPAGTGRKERFPAGGGAEQEEPFRNARSRKARPGMGDGSRSGEGSLREIFPEKPAVPVSRPLMQGKDGSRKKDQGKIVEEISLEPAGFEPGNAFSPVREGEGGKTLAEDARPEASGGREARRPFSLRDAVIAKTLLDRKYF